MASFTINIPDSKATGVINALCNKFKYREDSGISKTRFAKNQILNFIREAYISSEVESFREKRRLIGRSAKDYVSDIDVS